MRSASVSRPGLQGWFLAAAGAAAPACGLLTATPDLPPPDAVAAAKLRDAVEWTELAEVVDAGLAGGAAGLPGLQARAAERPGALRLRAVVQDLEVAAEGFDAVAERYRLRHAAAPGPVNAWLAARVTGDRDPAIALLDAALAADPGLVPARVLRLGLEAKVGDASVLDDLVRLLAEHPGSAEGWRLLQKLSPLYARSDLAHRAASTEPWSPHEPVRRAVLAMAEAALADEQPRLALRHLDRLPQEDREARHFRAAAWTAAGDYELALTQLRELVADDPGDPMAHFNLGLLAVDYLHRPQLAARELRNFLDLVAAGADVPLQRKIQAELWLSRIETASAAAAAGTAAEMDGQRP
ncbi:MAG TPA: hypothetical protein VGC54_12070 [Planctomycetota bacterium]